MIRKYAQGTFETCLACCLLTCLGAHTDLRQFRRHELACITHAMRYSKHDFVAGHLDYVARHFGTPILRILDTNRAAHRARSPPGVTTKHRVVTRQLIESLTATGSLILYVDAYVIFHICHYPHFVTVFGRRGKAYRVFDPWDGKEKLLTARELAQGVRLLRNHIGFYPQIIVAGPATSRGSPFAQV